MDKNKNKTTIKKWIILSNLADQSNSLFSLKNQLYSDSTQV